MASIIFTRWLLQFLTCTNNRGFLGGTSGREPVCQYRRHRRHWFESLGLQDRLEEGMATHSSILTWRTPGTEEIGGLQSIVLPRIQHKWRTEHVSTHTEAQVSKVMKLPSCPLKHSLLNPSCTIKIPTTLRPPFWTSYVIGHMKRL